MSHQRMQKGQSSLRSRADLEIGAPADPRQAVARFLALVEAWKEGRGFTSSVSRVVECAAYRRVIGMGENALPFILHQIRREGADPDHWFVALEAITGENPIPEAAYGDMRGMADAWLQWAQQRAIV